MNYIDKITTLHLDILKEIGNIGAGHAATALSKLLNKKIEMKVPNVRIASFDEMIEMAGGAENVVASVFLRIDGDAPGNMFFVVPLKQGTSFIQQMIGDDCVSLENPPFDELALSALAELGNILSGSYLTSLSDFTGLTLYPSVPAISIDMIGATISYGLIELSQFSDHVIVIDTALDEMDDESAERLEGHFFLLPDPKSFDIIFRSLGVGDHE